MTMSDAKLETIAAIRRLSPSASEAFLDDFSERQLQAFLRRLEEVEDYRNAGRSADLQRRGHSPN
jgi:hypothetical protein